jgi:hypothetical protein
MEATTKPVKTKADDAAETPVTPPAAPVEPPKAEAKADDTQTEPEAELAIPADVFAVEGTVALRSDGGAQGAYNLRIVSKEAQDLLLANQAYDKAQGQEDVQVQNGQGEFWVSVKATAGARTKIRQARSSEVMLKGTLRLQKAVNGRYVAELFEVTSATAVTLRNGGRHVQRQAREDFEPALETAARGGGQGGMRSMLNRFRG